MNIENKRALERKCLHAMLRPLIKFCLKRAFALQDIVEIAKHVFVEVASEQMKLEGKTPNVSRLNVTTGIHRRDIMRVLHGGARPEGTQSLISKVLGQWEQDTRFLTKSGKPRILSYEGDKNSFQELVSIVTTDIHHGTVLFELERAGLVERVAGGLKLLNPAAITAGDAAGAYEVLGQDVGDLIELIDQNISKRNPIPNLHAVTEYTNIFKEDVPKIRRWLLKQGSIFHKKARAFLAKHDKDLNPHLDKQAGGKVVIGTFSKTD